MQKKSFSFTLFSIGAFIVPFFMVKNSIEIKKIAKEIDRTKEQLTIHLGEKLFFEKRLSINNTVSCATCHVPKFAFTDRKKVSEGVYGRKTERNSPSLLNSYKLKTVMYDAHLPTLEMQVIVPIQEHVEMDMKMIDLIKKIKQIEPYNSLAIKAFDREFDAYVLTRSIAAYERTLLSENSRFDQYYSGKNKTALTRNEKAGWKIFSEKLYCTKCHPAPDFTTYLPENNGLYKNFKSDKGRFRIHLDSTQIGFFKIPSLRNSAITYPYMHDGSMQSLNDVIDHYSRGGAGHTLQSKNIQPFNLSKEEKYQLIVFLKSLTDLTYLKKSSIHTK
jgi:cytochrome c peroxidase